MNSVVLIGRMAHDPGNRFIFPPEPWEGEK